MKRLARLTLAVALVAGSVLAQAGEVMVSFSNARVTMKPAPVTDLGGAAKQPATLGSLRPGVVTVPPPPRPIKTTPYSNDGPLQTEAPVSISSPVPGQVVGQGPETVGAPLATRFQNPYGLPEPVRPAVASPNAIPYGLTAPVRATPAPAPPPPPIKKSGTGGGQD